MKRVTVFKNGTVCGGKAMLVPDLWDDFKKVASDKLSMEVTHLYNRDGGEIDDINLIYDNDVLYVSGGEAFKRPVEGDKDEASVETAVKKIKIDEVVEFSVRGEYFSVSRSAIEAEPKSTLLKIINAQLTCDVDNSGAFLINRDPAYFGAIINYLRSGQIKFNEDVQPKVLLEEAQFYGIDSMINGWNKRAESIVCDIRRMLGKRPKVVKIQHYRFECANLTAMYFDGIDFQFSSFNESLLIGARFERCNLDNASFQGASMENVIFNNINSINNVNFEDAKMKECDLTGNKFKSCNFRGAVMGSSKCGNALFESCNFVTTSLDNIKIDEYATKPNFVDCDFTDALLYNFSAHTISNSKLIRARLSWKGNRFFETIENCDFTEVDLSQVRIDRRARVSGCDFTKANFSEAYLESFYFVGDCLKGANFGLTQVDEDCSIIDLPAAEVDIQDLQRENNFTDVVFRGAQFKKCCFTYHCLGKARELDSSSGLDKCVPVLAILI